MIYLLIENHNQEYSLSNLIQAFFPEFQVQIIKNKNKYLGKGILIESVLEENGKKIYALTKLYIDDKLLTHKCENIEEIQIKQESKSKKITIGIRKSLFSALKSASETETPWGILTGVRPLKIVHDLINRDIAESEIKNILAKDYKLKQDKIELMMSIINIQEKYIYPIKDQYSLYISIPFCPSKCNYCSFPSVTIKNHENYIDKYIEKLIYELKSIKKIMAKKDINTVYIGGGTPTAIPQRYLERVIQSVHSNFGQEKIREFTVEAGRPDTIDLAYLEMLKRNNIKRISINPQSMNDETLINIGRRHSVEDIVSTYKLAKKLGFDCINMDLIIGLSGEEENHFKNTIREIRKLDPDNLTVHTLAIKTKSKMNANSIDHSSEKQNILREMLNVTLDYAEEMELYPYYLYRQKKILGNLENIGFAKKGKECIYNIVMMEEKETVIGIGMGAISKIYDPKKDKIERLPNFKSLDEYINRVDDLILKKQRAIENL